MANWGILNSDDGSSFFFSATVIDIRYGVTAKFDYWWLNTCN